MRKTLTAALAAVLLGGCTYLDTPEERQTFYIGAASSVVLAGAAAAFDGESSGSSCPPGWSCVTPPPGAAGAVGDAWAGYFNEPDVTLVGSPTFGPK